MPLRLNLIAMSALLGTPAFAADERRLTPAEVERILEEAAQKRAAQDQPARRGVEGEVGVSVGTGGYRQIFGTAVVPVGDAGTAIVSIESGDTRADPNGPPL